MPPTKITQTIKMRANQYTATYYKQSKRGEWKKFWFCGNAGIACDVNKLLRSLGIRVIIEWLDVEDSN